MARMVSTLIWAHIRFLNFKVPTLLKRDTISQVVEGRSVSRPFMEIQHGKLPDVQRLAVLLGHLHDRGPVRETYFQNFPAPVIKVVIHKWIIGNVWRNTQFMCTLGDSL